MKKIYDTRLIPLDILAKPNQQVVVKCIKNTITRKVGYVALWEEVWGHMNKTFWEPQRLVITSDEPVGSGWYIDDNNLIRKSVTDDADYWAVRKNYKRVEATYPSMPEISMIDIGDVIKWIKEGCSGSVELEVEAHVAQTSNNADTFPIRTYYDYLPTLTNNTVKMVWAEPCVDERQYLREDREYNETGYREEESDESPGQPDAAVPKYEMPATAKDCMLLSERSLEKEWSDILHDKGYPAGKTAMQVAIEQIVAKKQEMLKLYAEETNETGKDQIAQTNMGLSMALTILQSQLPAQRQQIEMAHMQGNKVGFQEGTNSYKGIKVKTTALQDAEDYYKKTYEKETSQS